MTLKSARAKRAAIGITIVSAAIAIAAADAQRERYDAIELRTEAAFDYSIQTVIPSEANTGIRKPSGSRERSPEHYIFEWRRQDLDGSRITKGAELRTEAMPWIKEQWLRVDFLAPKESFVGDSKFSIILQYHSMPDTQLGERWRSPVSSLVIRGKKLQYDYRSSKEEVTPRGKNGFLYTSKGSINLGEVNFDQWNTVIIHQKFDYENGSVRIWVNGSEFRSSPTGIGFNDTRGMFVKFGLYCPEGSDIEEKRISFRNFVLVPSTRYMSKPVSDAEAFHLLGVDLSQ